MKWIQTYPDDTAAHNTLSRNYRVVGRYEMAIAEAKESLRIRPKSYVPVDNLMFAYMAINRPDQAKSIFDDALSRGVDVLALRSVRYLIAFLEDDEAAMREQLVWTNGRPDARAGIPSLAIRRGGIQRSFSSRAGSCSPRIGVVCE